jgi:hypothetical protein
MECTFLRRIYLHLFCLIGKHCTVLLFVDNLFQYRFLIRIRSSILYEENYYNFINCLEFFPVSIDGDNPIKYFCREEFIL